VSLISFRYFTDDIFLKISSLKNAWVWPIFIILKYEILIGAIGSYLAKLACACSWRLEEKKHSRRSFYYALL